MKIYYCGYCNIHALAINYNSEIPICKCGLPMNDETPDSGNN